MTIHEFDDDAIHRASLAIGSTETELLVTLGRDLAGPVGSRDGTDDDAASRAENFLARHREELRRRICGNPRLDEISDSVTEAATVADLIATLTGAVPAYTVAAILVKRGIARLCS